MNLNSVDRQVVQKFAKPPSIPKSNQDSKPDPSPKSDVSTQSAVSDKNSVTLPEKIESGKVTTPAPDRVQEQAQKAAPQGPDRSVSSSETLVVLDTPAPEPSAHSAEIDGFLTQFLPKDDGPSQVRDVGLVSHAQLDFDQGAEVVSGAQKFILPVPQFEDGGEPLVYPEGAKNKEGEDVAGQPIVDWQGKPIGDKGLVFFNHKDQSWQAVKSDGQGVVIMNQVTEEQSQALLEKIGGDPAKLSREQFKEVLEFAHSELDIGDRYNSDRGFISSKMNPLESMDTGIPQFGLFRRDDRDVCHAVFIEGSGEFQGPAATPQKFEDGAVIIRQAAGKDFSYRLIQPEIFGETYKNKDGTSIELDKLPRQLQE